MLYKSIDTMILYCICIKRKHVEFIMSGSFVQRQRDPSAQDGQRRGNPVFPEWEHDSR